MLVFETETLSAKYHEQAARQLSEWRNQNRLTYNYKGHRPRKRGGSSGNYHRRARVQL